MLHNCSQQVRAVGKVISWRHNLWESFLGYLHSSVTFQMRVANFNFNYQPFLQILVPIIKRRKQQKTWKIWISNQSLGNLIFCRVGVLNWPNFSNRFHLSSSMVLRKSSRNAFFLSATLPLAHLTIWWLKLFLNWKCIRISTHELGLKIWVWVIIINWIVRHIFAY